MEQIKLTHEEAKFVIAAQNQLTKSLIPVPFFIRSVSLLQYMNSERITFIVEEMKKSEELLESCGMSSNRLSMILTMSGQLVLWKHGILMRLQWILQLVAIFFIWKFLCLAF